MALPVLGPKTTDDIPAELLRTEFIDSAERHNEADRNFKALFCKTTRKDTVEVRQRSMVFQESGSDTTMPDYQHLEYTRITIPDPHRYLCRPGLTRRAWEQGLAADEVREMHREALDADNRLTTQIVMRQLLTDGGWWDATMAMAPPWYKLNNFTVAHDHYLAANAGGVPAYTHFTRAKRHIQEHGYGFTTPGQTRLVAFINGGQGEQIENVANWIDPTNMRLDTDILHTLQRAGLTPAFSVAGIAVVLDDWVPEDYMVIFDAGEKICRWKQTDNPQADDLMVLMQDKENDVQFYGVGDYIRWGVARIALRGAGVAFYLGGAAWVDSTGWEV